MVPVLEVDNDSEEEESISRWSVKNDSLGCSVT